MLGHHDSSSLSITETFTHTVGLRPRSSSFGRRSVGSHSDAWCHFISGASADSDAITGPRAMRLQVGVNQGGVKADGPNLGVYSWWL